MRTRSSALRALPFALALGALLLPAPARADVGIEAVSRSSASPGERVTVRLGCGFCYPPCRGPKGERHPEGFQRGPCMLDTKAKPPRSFGISIVPAGRAPESKPCERGALCPPRADRPPHLPPFTFLGQALPPPGGNDPEDGVPRYLLRFEVPDLRPGRYAFLIYCGACLPGPGGALISHPDPAQWRLRIKRSGPVATIAGWLAGPGGWLG